MVSIAHHNDTKQTITELQERIRQCERRSTRPPEDLRLSGCQAFDELFPDQGVRPGSVVEWIGRGAAHGAVTLSLFVGLRMCRPGRPVVLIDPDRTLFPLALELFGYRLGRVVVVRPEAERDAVWACEEALRCPGVGFVWARLNDAHANSFRRLQLAAESSQGIGFLLRPDAARRQPAWADARLVVRPQPSSQASPRFRVEVASCHGRSIRPALDVALDPLRGSLHEVSHRPPATALSVVS